MLQVRSETSRRLLRRLVAALALLVCLLRSSSPALAGGGPENVLLVVNERSWSSLTIANHYIRNRKIPPQNVFYLNWTDDNERIDAATMRAKLLGPILAEIERRRLTDHIDYVVYSSDFPTLIDCSADVAPGTKVPPVLTPQASLTGVTFLHQKFMAQKPEYLLFTSNGYFRPATATDAPATHGFRSWYGWDAGHRLLEAGGEHYLLAAMLGVTAGRGNSTDEVVQMLARSAEADYSRPTGTIYFAENSDIRSKTRLPLFAKAGAEIRREGVAAEIFSGIAPTNKADVAGAMLGSPDFSLRETRSKLLPGAIGEHLTSHGGMLNEGAGQTPISEWVRAGSALTSGAVWEPYAVPQKFPSAYMHLHYVRGCSAGEAYYQSISGPYQMLVLGDPLCRPWARRATIEVAGLDSTKPASGQVTLVPTAKFDDGDEASAFELYIDGMLFGATRPGGTFTFDSRTLADGRHELRIMAIGSETIETRSGIVVPLDVVNHDGKLALKRVGIGTVRWGERLEIEIENSGFVAPASIVVAQGSRLIAQFIDATSRRIRLDPRLLGSGPVTLQAYAVSQAGPIASFVSPPLELEIEGNEPLPKFPFSGEEKLESGAALTRGEKPATVITSATFDDCLREAGVDPGEKFTIDGFFEVEEDGTYQFHVRHGMRLSLAVDDRPLYGTDAKHATLDNVPVALKAGRHKLQLRGTAGGDLRLDIRFGLRGVQRMQPSALKHAAS
ncbi:MAG: hypothetical protein K8U03_00545 [Planctomycetia bacterium]|nr:hypothetical protein [Planctomycetia bacterium]